MTRVLRSALRAAACAACACFLLGAASEVADTDAAAFAEYLSGAYDDAATGYQYIVTLGAMDPAPTANLALVRRDAGKPDEAAAHWLKATLIAPEDPFLWCQRGWNYLALGQHGKARDSFRKAVQVSSASIFAGEAYLGLGLTDSLDGNTTHAVPALQEALGRSPYLQAAAAAELGRVARRKRRYPKAAPILRMSLTQDSMQPDVTRVLGRVFEKTGEARAAWQAYKLVLDADPGDSAARKRKEKLERYLEGRPTDSIPVIRLARPMMQKVRREAAIADSESPALRVALFSGPDGTPRHLTRFYVMGSSDTVLWDLNEGEEIRRMRGFNQWEVRFRPDNRLVEIRDTVGNIVFVTKQPFELRPVWPGHTVLVKNPELTDITGTDFGDREMRGSVEVIPTPWGFHMVNEVPLEMYLFSVIGEALPRNSPIDAYKAMAVLMRSRLSAVLRRRVRGAERTHLPDSGEIVYRGLTRERANATRAVRATRKVTITLPQGERPEYHRACGWATAKGIQDRRIPGLLFRSPYDLEKLVHGYPDKREYSEASALVPAIWNRWLRILDAKHLREHLERRKEIGPLRRVRVAKRDRTGRVSALHVVGSRGSAALKGFSSIEKFLSPGGIRSSLFTLQPVYKGRKLLRLLVWGAGTGHGRGLCVAGALGQARLGVRFDDILSKYFPGAKFTGLPPKPKIIRRKAPKPKRVRKRRAKPGRRPPRKRRRRRRRPQ